MHSQFLKTMPLLNIWKYILKLKLLLFIFIGYFKVLKLAMEYGPLTDVQVFNLIFILFMNILCIESLFFRVSGTVPNPATRPVIHSVQVQINIFLFNIINI